MKPFRSTQMSLPFEPQTAEGLLFNEALGLLIGEILRWVPDLNHIKLNQLRVSVTYNKSRSRSGLLAYLLPMKFRGGSPVEVRHRGKHVYHWAMLPQFHEGREILYLIYFMVPRFTNLSFRDKLETIIHELYHVHPDFNGDLRRFSGRSQWHGNMKDYDRKVSQMTDCFLNSPHNPHVYEFLKGNHGRLMRKYGNIRMEKIREPRPRLLKKLPLPSVSV